MSTTDQRLAFLIERVKDDPLRAALASLQAQALPLVPADESEVRLDWNALLERVTRVNAQLGETLRRYL